MTFLHSAAGAGDLSTVQKLLAEGADPNALEPRCGASPLHLAAQSGRVPVAEALLAAGSFLNLQAPANGFTPLMNAVMFRKLSMVQFFLKQPRINVELRSALGLIAEELVGLGGQDEDTRLHEENASIRQLFQEYKHRRDATLAVEPLFKILTDPRTTPDVKCKLLAQALTADGQLRIDAFSPNSSSGDGGYTPLLIAARDGNAEAVALLLEAGADQTIVDEYMQAVPAHKAAYSGHAEALEPLVRGSGFDRAVNVQGPFNGYTALHDATWHGHTAAVRALVDGGARKDIIGWDGKTPADIAAEFGYNDCLALLTAEEQTL